MLNLQENRDKLIRRVLDEAINFEFEASDIMDALFESKEFQDTKNKKFREKKLNTKDTTTFFSNTDAYIKNARDKNAKHAKNTKTD